MILIGYARVSTDDQKLNLQQDALRVAGCEKIFEDYISGAKAARPGLTAALEMTRSGDTLVVWRLDRLGRSLKDLIQLTETLKERGIGLNSLQEAINTTSSSGQLVFHLFGALAEFERNLIRERTQAGLTAARVRGRTGGRPKALDINKRQLAVKLYNDRQYPIGEICQMMGISKPTLYNYADDSNDCWHFDLSPSDLKHIAQPAWVEPGRGNPLLMLYSIVDDRSGMCYQEYHCVYGENVEAALRFLFNAMTAKADTNSPFQGIPAAIYADNGPISKSQVFQNVLSCLGIKFMTHMPKGSDGRRVTARSKGKVERPFRTVKEAHETLYHFHQPETEVEANQWLHQYLLNYNDQRHRESPHSRVEDWLQNIPKDGLRAMCSWERFCTFAREPQRRKVGGDARVSVEGVAYEVDPDLAGETVILWWGLFDNELYVERDEQRYGPFYPVDGPIPLHRYRKFKKTRTQKRADKIAALAKQLELPRAALTGNADLQFVGEVETSPALPMRPFQDRDPYQEFTYPTTLMAKLAIADYLGQPLAKLSVEHREFISTLVEETLTKKLLSKC